MSDALSYKGSGLTPGQKAQLGKVFVDGLDTTVGFLSSKLAVTSNLLATVLNPGGNEQLQLDVNPAGSALDTRYIKRSPTGENQTILPLTDNIPLTLQLGAFNATSDFLDLNIVPGKTLVKVDSGGHLLGALPDLPIVVQNTITRDGNIHTATTGSANNLTVTLPVTLNHEIIVGVVLPSGITVTSITDTLPSSTYAQRATFDDGITAVFLWSTPSKKTNAADAVKVNFSALTSAIVFVYSLNGPVLLGTTNSSALAGTPETISLTTQDTNNWVVAVFSEDSGTGDTFTALTGTLVGQGADGANLGCIVDNSSANAASTTCAVNTGFGLSGAGVIVEFRSALPSGSTLTTDGKIKFVDTYGAGFWLPPDTIVYDTNNNGKYDAGEPVISGTAPAVGTTLTSDAKLKFFEISILGTWAVPDPVVWDGNANGSYDTTQILPITGNLTVSGILTQTGTGTSSFTGPLTVNGLLSATAAASVTGFINLFGGVGVNPNSYDVLVTAVPAFANPSYGLKFGPQFGFNGNAGNSLRSVGAVPLVEPQSGVNTFAIDQFYAQLVFLVVGGSLALSTYRSFHGDVIVRPSGAGSITVTDSYGLDLEDSSTGNATITNKWGIRQQGASDLNRFAGLTRIGDLTTPKIGLEIFKGFAVNVLSKSANYGMAVTDYVVLATGGAGGITITLPAAAGAGTGVGQKVIVIKVDAGVGAVTVAASGADTIQGAAHLSLAAQYNKAELISDNVSVWYDLGAGLI